MTREFIPLKGRQLALVEHLEAEIERLTAARDAAMRVHMEDGAEIERLRAELGQVREILRGYASVS